MKSLFHSRKEKLDSVASKYLSDSAKQFCFSEGLRVSIALRIFSFALKAVNKREAVQRIRNTLYIITSSVLQKEPHRCCNTSLIVST